MRFFRSANSRTAYLTLPCNSIHGESSFEWLTYWAAIRERLRPLRLLCVPLHKIPQGARLVIFSDLQSLDKTLDFIRGRSPDTLRLIQFEPPVYLHYEYQHIPACYAHFSHIYTLRDDIQGPKFRKIQYPHPLKSRSPNPQQRLLTMMVGYKGSSHPKELYTERRRVIEFFEDKPDADFTFYGYGWEFLGYRNYGGIVEDKLATLSNFRFTIAYENCHSMPGYITEKIFDCLCAGSVPIYWGAPNIADYIPSDCFIDRTQFPSNQALYNHLLTLDPAPYLAAAQRFLASEQAKRFSYERFISLMTADIQEVLEA